MPKDEMVYVGHMLDKAREAYQAAADRTVVATVVTPTSG